MGCYRSAFSRPFLVEVKVNLEKPFYIYQGFLQSIGWYVKLISFVYLVFFLLWYVACELIIFVIHTKFMPSQINDLDNILFIVIIFYFFVFFLVWKIADYMFR